MSNQKLPARVAALITTAAHNSAAADRLAAKEVVHAKLPARFAALITDAARNSAATDRLAAKVNGFDVTVRALEDQVHALEATMAGCGRRLL
jgi:ribosomal protein L17